MIFWRIYYEPALDDREREYFKSMSAWGIKVKFIDKGTPCVICYDCVERDVERVADEMWRKFNVDVICTQMDRGILP